MQFFVKETLPDLFQSRRQPNYSNLKTTTSSSHDTIDRIDSNQSIVNDSNQVEC